MARLDDRGTGSRSNPRRAERLDTGLDPERSERLDTGLDPERSQRLDTDLDAQVRLALATWPQIDPEVEGIVSRVAEAFRYLDGAARESLARVGLTKEEFKVLLSLFRAAQSHGSLCRDLGVSTGAMTNRLDKLERAGLVRRSRDPSDRRGVLLHLTERGREKLDQYADTGARRERQLLAGLSDEERRQLNVLLRGLLASLESELGTARR